MQESLTAKKLTAHFGDVGSIAMSTRGDLFATGATRHQAAEGVVRLWNLSSGEPAGEISTDLNSIFGLAISPDGRFLAAGGGGAVFGMRWEYTSGVEVWSLKLNRMEFRFGDEELFFVKSLAFSPDGSLLLTSSVQRPPQQPHKSYKCVRLWRTSDFRETAAFGEQEDGVGTACFSPNGQFVVFVANPTSAGMRAPSGLRATLRKQNFMPALLRNKKVSVQFHDVSSMVPVIRIWNIAGQKEEPRLELPKGRVTGLAFSPDGRTFASCGSSLITWNFENRKLVKEFAQGPQGFSHCIAFSPNGGILASGSGYRFEPGSPYEDCGVKLWDSQSGRLIAFLPHKKTVHSLAFSPDGQTIVAGGEGGELLMWNVASVSH